MRRAHVVVPVLRTGDGVQVEVDPKAIFASPLDRLEEVSPADVRKERLSGENLDHPVRDGDADPV